MKNKNVHIIVDGFARALAKKGISIKESTQIDWIDRIVAALPSKYPPSFMSFISRYVFDEFAAGKIQFFSNHGSRESDDLCNAIFEDPIIFKTTRANGFLHFARPEDDSYDPVCFDIRLRNRGKEYVVVRLDHEAILQFERIKIVDTFYSSLLDLMEEYIQR